MVRKTRVDAFTTSVNAPTTQVATGQRLRYAGQTGSNPQFNIANQGIGSKALPALAGNTATTVTISDTNINSTSIVFFQVKRAGASGATTPAAATVGFIQIVAPTFCGSGSVVVDVVNTSGTAILATDYELWYWAVGPGLT